MGLIGCNLSPLISSRCFIHMSPASFMTRPSLFAEMISRYRANTTASPSFGYDLCARKTPQKLADNLDLSCMGHAVNGAEPVRREAIDLWCNKFATFDRKGMAPAFGMAESTLIVTMSRPEEDVTTILIDERAYRERIVKLVEDDEHNEGKTLSVTACGYPTNCDIAIVSEETREVLPSLRAGEIWTRGPRVTQGYYGREEATANTFHAELLGREHLGYWLRTGDLGFVYGGQLYVCGRLKDVIIVNGKNLYPNDLEATVDGCHPAVRPGCCAIFVVDGDMGEEVVCCVVEVRSHQMKNINLEDVCVHVAQSLRQGHEVRVGVVALLPSKSIPKTTSGKIQRQQTKASYLCGALPFLLLKQFENVTTPALLASSSCISVCLCLASPPQRPALLRQFLSLHLGHILCLSPDFFPTSSTFADLGVTSVEMVSLRQLLSDSFPFLSLDPMLLYDNPAIDSLADYLLQTISTHKEWQQQHSNPVRYLRECSEDAQRAGVQLLLLLTMAEDGELPLHNVLRDEATQFRDVVDMDSEEQVRGVVTPYIASMIGNAHHRDASVESQPTSPTISSDVMVNISENNTLREIVEVAVTLLLEEGIASETEKGGEEDSVVLLMGDGGETSGPCGREECSDISSCPLIAEYREARVPESQYIIVGVIQCLLSFTVLPAVGVISCLPAFLYLEWLYGPFDYLFLFFRDPIASRYALFFVGFPVAYLIAVLSTMVCIILLKWLVLGKMRPRKVKLWSAYFVRWWLVKTAFKFYGDFVLLLFKQTLLHFLWLRALGVRMPSGFPASVPIFLSEFDLIEIGGGASINGDANIFAYGLTAHGIFSFDHVHIGENSKIGYYSTISAPANLEPYGIIPPFSSLPGETKDHFDRERKIEEAETESTPVDWSLFAWRCLSLLAIIVAILLSTVPGLAVMPITSLLEDGRLDAGRYTGLVFVLVAVCILLVGQLIMVILVKRVLLPFGVQSNIKYPARGWFMWRKMVVEKHFDFVSQHFLIYFQRTHLLVWLAKAMGMRIANNVLITNSKLGPAIVDLVSFSTNVFVGGSAQFVVDPQSDDGGATVYFSEIYVEECCWLGAGARLERGTRIGRSTQIAARAVVEEGVSVPPESLVIGVPGKVYSGVPLHPFQEASACWQVRRFFNQISSIFIIIILLVALLFPGYELVRALWISANSRVLSYVSLGLWFFLFNLEKTILAVIGKWILLRRQRVGVLSTNSLNTYIVTWLLYAMQASGIGTLLQGSPAACLLATIMGASFGKCVYWDSVVAFDFDLLQATYAHNFDGNVMHFGRMEVGPYCTVLCNAYLHRGVTMGHASSILPGSYALPGETLRPHCTWRGAPAARVS